MGNRIKIDLEFEDSEKTVGKYLIFDTETTGLPIDKNAPMDDFKNWPYVVQIAWLLFDDEMKLIKYENHFLKQPVSIPTEATKIHGITSKTINEKGIEPSVAYSMFKKTLDNTDYLIAHNIDFDIPIVCCDFLRNGLKWNFPNDKLCCTMKLGEKFCKIRHRNGQYKWPKLTELYQKCFYPNKSIKIFSDAISTNQFHAANIDAGMTAQCFFKLIDLGFLKEVDNTIVIESLADEQNNKPDELHYIYEDEEYTENDDIKYIAEIKHIGLGTSRVIKDKDEFRLDEKVEIQFQKWDEKWEKVCEKEMNLRVADEKTKEAQNKQKQIENLLVDSLSINNEVVWKKLKERDEFKIENPNKKLHLELKKIKKPQIPIITEIPKKPEKKLYDPRISMFDKLLYPLYIIKIKKSEKKYQKARNSWQESVEEIKALNAKNAAVYEKKIKEYETEKQKIIEQFKDLELSWLKEKERYNDNKNQHNKAVDELKESYLKRNEEAVLRYCEIVLDNQLYPENFPNEFDLEYISNDKLLIVNYTLPSPGDLPILTKVKYLVTKQEFRDTFLPKQKLAKNYNAAVYKIVLRTLNVLFNADQAQAIQTIILNGWVNTICKATGKKGRSCIVTIQVDKTKFNEIELSNVEPKICVKHLNGVASNNLSDIIEIQPTIYNSQT